MKRISVLLAAAAIACVFAIGSSSAQARSSYSIGFNTGPAFYGGYYPAPYYYYPPPPVYYPPPYYGGYYGAPFWGGLSFSYHHR